MFPQRITEDELQSLLPLVKQGDKKAINRVIEGNMRLAYSVACKIAATAPKSKKDDIIDVAFLTLVHVTNNFPPDYTNYTTYLLNYVRLAIRDHLVRDNIVYVPNESKQKVKIKSLTECQKTVVDKPWLDITDMISVIATEPYDEVIIRMKMLDYTQAEIAKQLNLFPVEVSRILKAIGNRYAKVTHADISSLS